MDKIKVGCYEYDGWILTDKNGDRSIGIDPEILIELVHKIEERMKEDNYYE